MTRTTLVACVAILGACSSPDSSSNNTQPGDDTGLTADSGGTTDIGSTADPDTSLPGTDMSGGGGDDMGSTPDVSTPAAGPCNELPITGPTIDVSPGDDLRAIAADAAPGTTILLADGTYVLDGGDGSSRIQLRTDGLTLRGASGDASAVILDGNYATNELVTVHANDVTIAHLTITRAENHLIHATPQGTTIRNTRIHDVRLIDGGEQFIKVNSDGSGAAWVDDGEVSCSTFILTDDGRPNIERNPGGCYTGGVDAHMAQGWHIHNNHFEDIYCAGEGLAEHAVHFWSASRDTVVENNTIINCARGIGYGLIENGQDRAYPDDPYPDVGYIGHIDGIIRNNVIYADIDFYDTGIELAQAQGVRVYHNTVVSSPDAGGFYTSIDSRFPNTKADIRNNIARRFTERNGGVADKSSNIEGATLDLFVDAAAHDFHLADTAAAAIDQGEVVADSGVDIDGDPHANGAPDIGADEL